jgi:hypothetical protein
VLLFHTLLVALANLRNTVFPATLKLNHEDAKNTKAHEGQTHSTHAQNKRADQPIDRSQIERSFLLLFFKKEVLSFCSFLKKRTKKLLDDLASACATQARDSPCATSVYLRVLRVFVVD